MPSRSCAPRCRRARLLPRQRGQRRAFLGAGSRRGNLVLFRAPDIPERVSGAGHLVRGRRGGARRQCLRPPGPCDGGGAVSSVGSANAPLRRIPGEQACTRQGSQSAHTEAPPTSPAGGSRAWPVHRRPPGGEHPRLPCVVEAHARRHVCSHVQARTGCWGRTVARQDWRCPVVKWPKPQIRTFARAPPCWGACVAPPLSPMIAGGLCR